MLAKGYKLIGWNVGGDTEHVYLLGSTDNYNFVSEKLYPVYSANGDKIVYQNLTSSISDITITKSCQGTQTNVVTGEAVSDICIPEASNYAFTGWKTDKGTVYNNGTIFNPNDFKTTTYTLKGNWVRKITFNYSLGTNPNGSGCSNFTLDKAYPMTISNVLTTKGWSAICNGATPKRNGHTFNGWYDKPQGDPEAKQITGSLP